MKYFALFAALLVTSIAAAQPVSDSRSFTWEHNGLDTNGATETLGGFEIGLNSATGITVIQDLPDGTTRSTVLGTLGLPDGAHTLHVRAYDLAGNRSTWSTAQIIDLDNVPPAAPSTVTITFELKAESPKDMIALIDALKDRFGG